MPDAVRLGFIEAMYNAACDGRKTQTRRVIGSSLWDRVRSVIDARLHDEAKERLILDLCPYGGVGTRLGLTEPFRVVEDTSGEHCADVTVTVEYKWRGGALIEGVVVPASHADKPAAQPRDKWLSGRFMPLWAVRRWAVNAGVRVERVQEISEADCYAEGIAAPWPPLGAFAQLWDSINARRSYGWEANPAVWAITFRMEEQADE